MTTMMRGLFLVALVLASSPAAAQDLLIRNARIIDGTGRVIENGSVLVDDGRIFSVASGDARDDAALTIDAGGKTVMPGMIDTHVHLNGTVDINSQTVLRYLELGFTTIADNGGNLLRHSELRYRIATGGSAPRILTSVSLAGPGNHPVSTVCRRLLGAGACSDIREVADPASAREMVRRYGEFGVDFIKAIYEDNPPGTKMADDVLRAIAQEAHAIGLRLTVHAPMASDAIRAVELGADRFAHAPVRSETEAIDIDALGRTFVPKAVPFATTAHFVAPLIDASGASTAFGGRPFTDSDRRAMEAHLSRIRALWDAGVTVAFGTDSFVAEPTDNVRREIDTLHRVLSPNEVLRALTRNAAAYLGLDSEIGTLEAGKRADIVIIDGDPVADIDDLRNVAVVIQAGKIVVDKR
jgi:imidazolonepropionase-like amidohydrolase